MLRKMAEDDSGIGDLYEGIRMVEASVFPSNENPELGNTPEKVSLPLRIPEVEESVVLCATSFREGALESAGEVDGRHLAECRKDSRISLTVKGMRRPRFIAPYSPQAKWRMPQGLCGAARTRFYL